MSSQGLEFVDLLRPVEPATFFSEYWEQRPLIVSRQAPDYYKGLFSTSDVDTLLTQSRPRYPQIRVISKNQGIPFESLLRAGWLPGAVPGQESDANINSLYAAYAQGYTIVVELERLWWSVSMLCRNLEKTFHHKASAELYMTPKGAQGFDLHFDLHDVFVLQLEGAKQWQVYKPLQPLPVAAHIDSIQADQVGTPLLEVCLQAGDMLYIPRGFPHQASTSECSSLHITFGIYVFRWENLIAEALPVVSEQDIRFRESLPIGFLESGDDQAFYQEHLRELLSVLLEKAQAEAILEKLRIKFLGQLAPVPDGHFAQINQLQEITLDTVVEKRSGTLCHISKEGDLVSIYFPGNQVRAPQWVEPALRFILKTAAFPVRNIPDFLDDDSKLVLVRRLVKEGLLRIVKP